MKRGFFQRRNRIRLSGGKIFAWWALGVAVSVAQPADHPRIPPWVRFLDGIEMTELTASEPRLMRGYAARIDLKNPSISFITTPDNGDAPKETDALKTSSFLKKYGGQLAINAAPFDVVQDDEGVGLDIQGLQVSEDKPVSAEESRYPAVMIHKDNRVTIANPPFDMKDVSNAVGGFGMVLEHGANVGDSANIHPRTGAGVSRDGRYLLLLVIDGRQAGWSIGATKAEVGRWLELLGAWDGINLDGGGTTALVIEDEKGEPKVINRPIHKGIPGNERPAGSHLGVRCRHEGGGS